MPATTPRNQRTVPRSAETLRIGFVTVTDCAPLLVARELGLFQRQGLHVALSWEAGWGTVRERLLNREIDGAHAVAGLLLAMRLGLGSAPCRVVSAFIISRQGNAITISHDLWRRGVRDAVSLRKLIRSTPQRLFTFGVVSHVSAHRFLMRRWLLSGGIKPGEDVRLVVLPPSQMPACLKAGLIDGFCAGEPWNSVAIAAEAGWCAATSADLDPGHPEKIFLVREELLERRRGEHSAFIRALDHACAYCDAPENRPAVVSILRESGFFRQAAAVLERSLVGPFDTGRGGTCSADRFHIFHRGQANRPTPAARRWLASEFISHGLLHAGSAGAARAELDSGWREDLYDGALACVTESNNRNSIAQP